MGYPESREMERVADMLGLGPHAIPSNVYATLELLLKHLDGLRALRDEVSAYFDLKYRVDGPLCSNEEWEEFQEREERIRRMLKTAGV
jgi:hypothetical protein